MTEEEAERYMKDCEGCGNLDYPLVGRINTPLCKICKNSKYEKYVWPPNCSVFGIIPDDLARAHKYECDGFVHNPSSRSNIFFDENHKPLQD